MKKETIILIGLGAVALYFVMQKRRRGAVFVESPEKISEEEFGKRTMEETEAAPVQTGKSILESVRDITKSSRAAIKRKKALKDVMFIPGTRIPISKKKFQKEIRMQKKKQRQAKRAESRIRRRKVGEISIMY